MIAIITERYSARCGSARIKAYCHRGKLIKSPSRMNDLMEHKYIAHLLIEKFIQEDMKKYGTTDRKCSSFHHSFLSGSTKEGYAHVLFEREDPFNANWEEEFNYHY